MVFQKSSNYIACVKVDGKILRDDADGVVNLPFGAEYSILLKNLNAVRATVKVWVDGVDATEGTSLILPANGSLELERFIRNGNRENGNKFKFIERTAGVEAHKGIGSDDGLIRVEYHTEIVAPVVREKIVEHITHVHHSYPTWPNWQYYPTVTYSLDGMQGQVTGGIGAQMNSNSNVAQATGQNTASMNFMANMAENSAPRPSCTPSKNPVRPGMYGIPSARRATLGGMRSRSLRPQASSIRPQQMIRSFATADAVNTVGVTVPGGESNQRFVQGAWFKTDPTGHVIVLQLRGKVGDTPVSEPITVKTKKKCSSCGKKNKMSDKFCTDCGTALVII
jgi:zinc-ribbon domain